MSDNNNFFTSSQATFLDALMPSLRIIACEKWMVQAKGKEEW